MRAPGELLHFMRGEPIAVEVGEIERALGDLWKQASSSGEAPPTRRRVARRAVEHRHPGARARRAGGDQTPGRRDGAGAADAHDHVVPGHAGGRAAARLQATIESNVVAQPGGARTVYSEEIMVAGPPGAEAHFGALVRALQVPAFPRRRSGWTRRCRRRC